MTGLLDLGDRVSGQVIDELAWFEQSLVVAALPPRHVTGEVTVIYALEREVVGVELAPGVRLTIAIGGVPDCRGCGHAEHEVGECPVGVVAGTLAVRCRCGEDEWLARAELADHAFEHAMDVGMQRDFEAGL